MIDSAPPPTGRRRNRARLLPVLAVLTALAALAVVVVLLVVGGRAVPSSSGATIATLVGAHTGGVDVDGGELPDGTTVFEDELPGVTALDPALLSALRHAAADAQDDGVDLVVNSGWRSAAYQNRLLDDAVAEYGSEAEAARWVATADTSAHVSGDAADIGPFEATAWLAEHGSAYGLCPLYANEPWHYELRPDAMTSGCPPLYADPTEDPRMQR